MVTIMSLNGCTAKPISSVLLDDARQILHHLELFKISHVHHQENQCADRVTKLVRENGEELLWVDGSPSSLTTIAHVNAIGTMYERD